MPEKQERPVTAVNIQRLEDSQLGEAADLVTFVFREMLAPAMAPEGIAHFERLASAEQMRQRATAGAAMYAAFDADRLVGILEVRDSRHVALLFTLPSHQRRGVARALVEAADRHQRLQTVNSSLYAVAAYERCGFRASGPEQLRDGIRFLPMTRQPPVQPSGE